ncbi:DUF7500 family protein [Natronorubrum texcoconense]|uniref:Uncharacterized protein n=1 Tax=Natronorubrum texcoconense TaxID=1095776 RepID=A0A1G9F8Z4_9EURY|nr:hypothetical protein [Natronorubrum texcoconense]SDK84815.1 hypothetical protein SAMN04515672_4132 [Natronorubrum texcoconense]
MTSDPTQDDGILTPEELQLEDDNVAKLSENRYLVRSDGAGATAEMPAADAAANITDADSSPAHLESTPSDQSADTSLAEAADPHGVEITLKTDGELAHHRATSHDVREVFVELLTWYAGQLDDDMSPSEALQVMLAASDLDVAPPSR